MSQIHILGSCSGTEPMPGRHHTSWILEHKGRLYMFDAGEGCAWTAVNLGLDILNIRQIFISHPHTDHTEGLSHLLVSIVSLMYAHEVKSIPPIELYTPSIPLVQSIRDYLNHSRTYIDNWYDLQVKQIADGPVFSDGEISVEARHNLHFGEPAEGEAWCSFSYRIKVGGKTIVYSADVKSIDDLGDWTQDCDWLMMESGHHNPKEVCEMLSRRNAKIGHILWMHHGRLFLSDAWGKLHRECIEAFPNGEVLVAHDCRSYEV